LRRATSRTKRQEARKKISIHALLAESDPFSTALRPAANISIHALLAESDERPQHNQYTHIAISIHALLAESDRWLWLCLSLFDYFYPRSPCGERRNDRVYRRVV